MCGSHQLCRPPGHKQHSSGQTLSRVCRAWGQVTPPYDQRSNEWVEHKMLKKKKIVFSVFHPLFLPFLKISEDTARCFLVVSVSDWHCALLVSRPGAVPSGNILWPCGPSGDQSHRNTQNKKLNCILRTKHKPLNIWTLETTIFSHQKCFYKSPFPHFRFQDCETDPRSLPSSCLIVKYNTSIIFNIRNSLIRTIPKLRPPLPSHIHIWSEILQL